MLPSSRSTTSRTGRKATWARLRPGRHSKLGQWGRRLRAPRARWGRPLHALRNTYPQVRQPAADLLPVDHATMIQPCGRWAEKGGNFGVHGRCPASSGRCLLCELLHVLVFARLAGLGQEPAAVRGLLPRPLLGRHGYRRFGHRLGDDAHHLSVLFTCMLVAKSAGSISVLQAPLLTINTDAKRLTRGPCLPYMRAGDIHTPTTHGSSKVHRLALLTPKLRACACRL